MKPKAETEHDEGMLEYLEDIIGSSRFKEPIEHLAKEVEDLSEARKEKVAHLLIWSYNCFLNEKHHVSTAVVKTSLP